MEFDDLQFYNVYITLLLDCFKNNNFFNSETEKNKVRWEPKMSHDII